MQWLFQPKHDILESGRRLKRRPDFFINYSTEKAYQHKVPAWDMKHKKPSDLMKKMYIGE